MPAATSRAAPARPAPLSPVPFPPFRRALALALAALAFAGFAGVPARAQAVLALVNSRPVTSFDVEQRIRIAQIVDRRRLDRKSALTELVDDQVKLIEARRIGYRVTEEGVEQEFTKLARSNRLSEREFEDVLKRSGLSANALRDKIRADLAWSVLLRDRLRRGTQVSNEEVERELAERQRNAGSVTEFELQPVVFVVPRGGSPAAAERAAAAVRARFTSCETGLDELREAKDVALRPAMRRTSAELPKPLFDLLNKTPVGRMTPPQRSDQGIEIVAVCGKRERDNTAVQRANIAAELAEKRISGNTRAYLEELRKKVEIRYPR